MSRKNPISRAIIAYAVALIVVGILFLVGGFNAAQTLMSVLVTVAGVIFIAYGVMQILWRRILVAVGSIVVGVVLIIFAWTITWIAFVAIAAAVAIYGIVDLCTKRGFWLANLLDIVIAVFVLLAAFGINWAWSFANVFFIIGGVLMIVDGILMLIYRP